MSHGTEIFSTIPPKYIFMWNETTTTFAAYENFAAIPASVKDDPEWVVSPRGTVKNRCVQIQNAKNRAKVAKIEARRANLKADRGQKIRSTLSGILEDKVTDALISLADQGVFSAKM